MSRSTYFVQECPTCGRNLQVRVQYLGKQVVCQHCGAKFEAYDASSGAYPPPGSSLSVLARAEELLQTAAAAGLGTPGAETLGLSSDVVPMPIRPR